MAWKDLVFKNNETKESETPKYQPPVGQPVRVPESTPAKSYLGGETRVRARSAAVVTASASAPSVSSTSVDSEFDSELREAMAQASSRGLDEFLEQMDFLKDMISDETTRAKKTLESLQRMLKISPEQLVSAVRERLDLVNQAKAHFENGLGEEVKQSIEGNSQAIQELAKQISENEASQKRLQQEHDRLVQNRDEAQRQIDNAKSESAKVRERFDGAYRFHQAGLNAVLVKVQRS